MTGLILVGLIPFAVMGILLGHLLTVDSIGPAMGGITALLALFGGVWFPISSGGALHDIAQALPSYWLVQAGQSRSAAPAGGCAAGSSSRSGRWSAPGSPRAPTGATPTRN